MRLAVTFVVPLTGLALTLCPVAQADPEWTHEDWNYTKVMSGYGINYQGRTTTNEMIEKAHSVCDSLERNPTQQGLVSARDTLTKEGILTQDETTKVSYAAVTVYCPQFEDLTPIR
jgi:hypothetical protein